ncbi:IGSF9B [Mytilus coruscus]|uniref:IGSF9B n=1 Tax=Mytilus coruscus TaxID=42192 RepID=A0A6J8D8P6_MYTCO|nr:IGSF9B [Mytilus coruscus]
MIMNYCSSTGHNSGQQRQFYTVWKVCWYIGNAQLVPTKYAIKEETAIVTDVFYDVKIQLDGYRITLTIIDLQEADFTNYTLRVYYGSQYVQHEVTLESASAPETPSNFTLTSSSETSITVQWIPGYNGGHTQTFYIEYRISGTNAWFPQEIKTSNQLDTHNLYTLSGLQDKTSYELRMYAKNSFNQSQHTEIATIRTLEKTAALGGVIGGVAGGLVAVIVILAIIAFVLFKRKKGSSFPNKRTRSHSDSEVEEGLKDNILYDGSEQEGLKVNVLYQSAGPESINQGPNAEYAEVTKPHKKPSKSSNDKYDVQKQNDVYADVDKKAQQKNVKRKKQKDKKKPLKSGKTKGLNNNPDGEYANSDIPMGNTSDGEYAYAEDRSAGNKKNEQGLEYADLTFGNQTAKGRQPVIHGDENRTIYSEVDHTKKAPPPPQESEYEETDIRHGKKN